MRVWEVPFVLEPADNDAGGDRLALSELAHLGSAAAKPRHEVAPRSPWNQEVRCPLVRLLFLSFVGTAGAGLAVG